MARSGLARELRIGAGLSLSELASVVGVTAGSIWLYENARTLPRGDHAVKYAEVLERLQHEGLAR